jgi:hypothetical protein
MWIGGGRGYDLEGLVDCDGVDERVQGGLVAEVELENRPSGSLLRRTCCSLD